MKIKSKLNKYIIQDDKINNKQRGNQALTLEFQIQFTVFALSCERDSIHSVCVAFVELQVFLIYLSVLQFYIYTVFYFYLFIFFYRRVFFLGTGASWWLPSPARRAHPNPPSRFGPSYVG